MDDRYEPTFAVEQFFVSAGLEDDGQGALRKVLEGEDVTTSIVEGIRAFLRNESAFDSGEGLGIPLADSGVLIISHPNPAVDANGRSLIAQVLHADFGIENESGDQRSTISLTLGTLERYPVPEPDGSVSHDAELNAHTLATSKLGSGDASVFVTSPLRSTAAGGGNPNPPGRGKVGYLVVENYIPEGDRPLPGGLERPLGGEESGYAVLRLLTGQKPFEFDDRNERTLHGHAAGLLEALGPEGVNVFFADGWDGNAISGNLQLSTDAVANTVTGSLRLSDASNELIDLGDRSAFVDDGRFATMSAIDDKGSGFGLVTAKLLGDQPTYQHVQWGFFFGDRIVEQANEAARREHVHLGSWVAGKLIEKNEVWKGRGTYSGHVVGNVISNGQLSTQMGSFDNTWDFGAKRGEIEVRFDSGTYSGETRYSVGARGFTGGLSGEVGGDRRTGELRGDFYRDAAAGLPDAVGGQFNLSGENYGAAGTFAGDRD